ncbi:unknown protein [Bathycoccus prasinos]|uniref:Uncharacterized protein n=1 Tax=Bathycoccus prasinos TaxID=41875 RepID=K8EWA2_9CHLO|nr:unknown protein [Bathycoccus prasinos]CCO16760.1 unknown protein [Bathycoccus prasinos]|eukprot:XP_007513202.1 unknown protein [Bathycoccus prasinos]
MLRRDIFFCARSSSKSSSSSSSSSILVRRKVLRASGESNEEDNTNHKRRRQRRPIEEMYNYFTKPVKCNECFGYNRRVCAHCQGRGKMTDQLLRMVMMMTIAAVDALAAGTCVATRATGPV